MGGVEREELERRLARGRERLRQQDEARGRLAEFYGWPPASRRLRVYFWLTHRTEGLRRSIAHRIYAE